MVDAANSPRVALFDLDGTLVDSVDGIAQAINPLLQAHGAAPLRREEAIPLLGDGLTAFAQRACTLRHLSSPAHLIEDFLRDYLSHGGSGARLYPGVQATLIRLTEDGWRLAVCTNKVEAAARRMLAELEVLSFFDEVCGSDTVKRQKPAPEHLGEALRRAGLPGCPAVMIGDNIIDLAAASAYGIPGIHAAWGYGRLPAGTYAPFVAREFRDLPALLDAALTPQAA